MSSRLSMDPRTFGTLLVAWLLIVGAMFVYCWNDPALDDFSGWLPTVVVLQLPAIWALWRAQRGAPRGNACTILFTISASLMTALGVLAALTPVWAWAWDAQWHAQEPSVVGAIALTLGGLGALLLALFSLPGILYDWLSQPDGERQVLSIVRLAGIVAVGVQLLVLAITGTNLEPGLWLVMSLPLIWVAPLLMMSRRPSATPVAIALPPRGSRAS
ncbi:MAG: hypothetical protein R3B48_30335 [Kofleriaceae bacterium]